MEIEKRLDELDGKERSQFNCELERYKRFIGDHNVMLINDGLKYALLNYDIVKLNETLYKCTFAVKMDTRGMTKKDVVYFVDDVQPEYVFEMLKCLISHDDINIQSVKTSGIYQARRITWLKNPIDACFVMLMCLPCFIAENCCREDTIWVQVTVTFTRKNNMAIGIPT